MKLKGRKSILKLTVIFFSFIIVSFILWNTISFFQKFKEKERSKMKIYAVAIEEVASNPNLNDNFNLVGEVYKYVDEIPSILTDENGLILAHNNLDSLQVYNPKYLKEQLELMKSQNAPIKTAQNQYVYYRNSDILYQLQYYPIALLLILALFLVVIYLFFNSTKIASHNRLWTGMAKETAHQIGTPLSSLMGWVEILRDENVNQDYVDEMVKDISRLNIITNRFSKIGANPELNLENVVDVCRLTYNYLRDRSSKQVQFEFETCTPEIFVRLNKELIGWVIENLIKNAIDAMKGKGKVSLSITELQNSVRINVIDNGKGVPRKLHKAIFAAGYTTKKRGWGLGLSLTKRIINDYHNGKVYVRKSEKDNGANFEIILNK